MSATNRRIALRGLGAAALLLITSAPKRSLASGGTDGFSALLAVVLDRAQRANDEAVKGADKQREVVKKEQELRQRVRETERLSEMEAAARGQAELLADLKKLQEAFRRLPCK